MHIQISVCYTHTSSSDVVLNVKIFSLNNVVWLDIIHKQSSKSHKEAWITQPQGWHQKNSYQMQQSKSLFVAVVRIHSLPDVECKNQDAKNDHKIRQEREIAPG